MSEKIAKIVSYIFHPVLIPTLGLLLLLNSGFYFSMFTFEAKRFILLVTLMSSCILPMLSMAVLAFNPKFDLSMPNSRDRIIPLLTSAVFFYLGSIIIGRVPLFPLFKLFMLASVLVAIALAAISYFWKISNHMAAIGSLAGTFFALSFRSGQNPVYALLAVVVVSGVVGTARLRLEKHNLSQLIAGYLLGFSILYAVIYFLG